MTQKKFKLFNKLLLVSVLLLLGSMLVSWFFASGMFAILTMDYTAPDLGQGMKKEIQGTYIWQVMTWETLVDSSLYYLLNFLPLFIIFPALSFFQEKRSLFVLGRHRFQSVKKSLVSSCLTYSFQSALAFSGSCTLFYSIGGLFVRRGLTDIGDFASIFPVGFYERHPYLFFMFMVWSIYFVMACLFSFYACGLALLCHKEYQVMLIILATYIGCNYIGGVTGSKFFGIFNSFGAFNTVYQTHEVFYVTLPLSLLGIGVWLIGVKKFLDTY